MLLYACKINVQQYNIHVLSLTKPLLVQRRHFNHAVGGGLFPASLDVAGICEDTVKKKKETLQISPGDRQMTDPSLLFCAFWHAFFRCLSSRRLGNKQ